MIAMFFLFCSSSVCKSENHHFDFKVCPINPPPPPPRCIILLFQLFLSATPHSGCSPSSDSRALWLFPSVCFTHADVLISDKTTGRIRRMTGKKLHLCVCVYCHTSKRSFCVFMLPVKMRPLTLTPLPLQAL